MAYQALYRKWRPLVFDDVVGQEHIVRTLKNQVMSDKLAHAYLFCGTRGTGKTSTAKILARAVNCLSPKDGNPCNECEVCRGILDESIVDVVELDGASRNKVENIRDIIDDVMFLPSVARKKVYIIDEVHMVTTQAFNALLKTLEEPPEHVVFILATTELNKVPATVLSRCQRFDFRRITNADIVGRLKTILAGDGRKVSDEGLSLVAELGDGSMRDSLSILDQCLGFSDEEITYDDIVNIIGITDDRALFSLGEAVSENDSKTALGILDEISLAGKEAGVFIERFVGFLRDVMIAKLAGEPDKILSCSQEKLNKIKALASRITKEKLVRALTLLNQSIIDAKLSGFARTIYELALVKICDPLAEDGALALADRVAELEKKLREGVAVAAKAPVKVEKQAQEPIEVAPWEENVPMPEEAPPVFDKQEQPRAEESEPEPVKEDGGLVGRWEEIVAYVKLNGGMPIFSHLKKAKPKMIRGKLGLVFDDAGLMSKSLVSKPANLELVKKAVLAVLGETVDVVCFAQKEVGDEQPEDDPLSRLAELSKTNSVIEII